MDSDALTLLLDERAIERALILFARAMDERDWSTMAAILTHDAFGDFGTGPLAGSAAIIELIRSYLDNCGPTQHLLGNVIVEVDGDTATSLAYVRDIHLNSTADPAVRFLYARRLPRHLASNPRRQLAHVPTDQSQPRLRRTPPGDFRQLTAERNRRTILCVLMREL